MTKLTFQDALFRGFKQFSFRKDVFDLTEENFDKCWSRRKDEIKDSLLLVNPEVSYAMTILPEEVLYNATETLYSGCFDKVIQTKEWEIWKRATQKFVEEMKELTTTYNVTNIELIK